MDSQMQVDQPMPLEQPNDSSSNQIQPSNDDDLALI